MARRMEFDTREVDELARNLGEVPARATAAVRVAGTKRARAIRTRWRAGARESSGKHGRHYPNSIEDHQTGILQWTISPNPARRQGRMSFEYGGPSFVRTPSTSPNAWGAAVTPGTRVGQLTPHLDGNKTADIEFPKWDKDVADAIEGSFR